MNRNNAASLSFYPAWAAQTPEHPALVTATRVLSYRELWGEVDALRLRWRASKDTTSRVVVDVTKSPEEWIIQFLAALSAGREAILSDPTWSPAVRENVLSPLAGDAGAAAGVWLFTSGTTMEPRPYFRSIETLVTMARRVEHRLPKQLLGDRRAVVALAPLYHGFGLIDELLLSHLCGATLIAAEDAEPSQALELLRAYSAQSIYGWPRHFAGLCEPGAARELRQASLRWCLTSSFVLDPAIAREFRSGTGCPLRQQYGSTETGPLCADGEEPAVDLDYCVGKPLVGVRVAVVDGAGAGVSAGEPGSVVVSIGDAASRATGVGFEAPWVTGDIGRLDGAGRVFILGRATAFTDERQNP